MLDDCSGLGGRHSRILDRWTATQAAPKAPQWKRPCRSRALSLIPNRSFVELRVREPRQGLVAFRIDFDKRGAVHRSRRGAALPRTIPCQTDAEGRTVLVTHA